jgi:hypothetical protein
MAASPLANSADYADALFSARRAKDVLVGLILLVLLFQLGLFFAARYKIDLSNPTRATDILQYIVGLTGFLGVVLPIILAVVLLLIVLIMLLGRLLGVSHTVSAFIACVVLATLLFPWQALLMNQSFAYSDFKIPGVLYTWAELTLRARAHPDTISLKSLYWARFVGWPVAALLILLKIHFKSASGLRAAISPSFNQPIDPTLNPPANL